MKTVKFDDNIPIYLQIKNYLYHQIITGDLQPGQKLPSIRQLAVQVTANANTVQRSLSEMVAEKVIESQRGKGNFVTLDTDLIKRLKQRLVNEQLAIAYDQLHSLNLNDEEIITEFKKFLNNRGAKDE